MMNRENMYLRDRAMRRSYDRDYRNPYGSRGGYVVGSRGGMRDRMDMPNDYPEYDSRYDYNYGSSSNSRDYNRGMEYGREYNRPMGYEVYGAMKPMDRPMEDYARGGRSYDRDYDYAYESEEKDYEEELHKWIDKLKKFDRFGWSKEQVVEQAKTMGVKFEEFDETEFFTTYLMVMSDFPKVANEPHTYLSMAKEWLDDKDAKKRNSEKLCCYLYEIVLGKEKED